MTTWLSTEYSPQKTIITWVKLKDGSVTLAKYASINHVWRTLDGEVIFPVEYQVTGELPNDDTPDRPQPDWLHCTVEEFISYWLAGWESGTIARPT